jgi:tetratricopeptide (TPR) repeat protein
MTACVTTGNETGLSLIDAIEQTGEKIAGELPAGSRVAIVAFESMNNNLSDYIVEELTGVLFDRGIEVADRQNLEYAYKELNFQIGGDVSDKDAKSIGKFLAADMVITGQLLDLGGMYRYRTNAVNVETAVRVSVTRLDVRKDRATRRMIAALANQKTTVRTAQYGVSKDRTPQTAGTFLDRGILFASTGDYEMAIADINEAIRLNPNMAAAYSMRGKTLYVSMSLVTGVANINFGGITTTSTEGKATEEQMRVFDLAIADYSTSIRLDPDNANNYVERGVVYISKEDFDLGVADFNRALQIDPNDVYAYHNRGNAYYYKKDYDRAIDDYSQAIRLNSNFTPAYSNRGVVYSDKNEYDKAIADFNQAIRLNPNFTLAYYGRGNAYSNKKDYDRAIDDYSQVIRLNSNYAKAYYGRGLMYSEKKDYDRAIDDYSQAIRLNPNYTNAYYNRGTDYVNKKDYDKAIADFNQAIRLNPNYTDAYYNCGIAYALKKDYDKSIAYLEEVLRIDSNYANAKKVLELVRQGQIIILSP